MDRTRQQVEDHAAVSQKLSTQGPAQGRGFLKRLTEPLGLASGHPTAQVFKDVFPHSVPESSTLPGAAKPAQARCGTARRRYTAVLRSPEASRLD